MKEVIAIEDEIGQAELTERFYHMFAKCFHAEVILTTVGTWKAGLEIICSRPIDVVLLDLILRSDDPPLDREETLSLISKTPDLPPVVILTGVEDDPFLADKCILAGADDVLIKRDVNHRPEILCRAVYYAFMRRQRDLRHAETA